MRGQLYNPWSSDPDSGLPLCSLGIMKDAWERLRQCISPTTSSMCQGGAGSSPSVLSQVFHFLCGSLLRPTPPSSLLEREAGSQADPKAITLAMYQQQQRAEVRIDKNRYSYTSQYYFWTILLSIFACKYSFSQK